jgi:hypothetical protein
MEHAPAPARPTASSQPTPPPTAIDQKVLEAVIGAVEARLHEHSGQMDRRWADLEARLAIMQGAQQQDRQASEQVRQEASALRTVIDADLRQMRESVAKSIAGQTMVHSELQAARQQHERDMASTGQRFDVLRKEMEQSVESRAVTAAAAAVASQMEQKLAPLRAEVEQKEKELAALRQRLAESERSALDVVLAIGEVCRQAADRIGGPRDPRPEAPAPPSAPTAEMRPKAEAAPPAPAGPIAMAPSAPVAKLETAPIPMAAADPPLAPSIPGLGNEANHRANWRVPLVSSFLVGSGYLVLMHYLALPLQ